MKPLWFKRKQYGWGWYPSTWQGWMILLLFCIVLTANVLRVQANPELQADPLHSFIPETVFLVVVLIGICYLTGETPRWQWGNETKKRKKSAK